MTAVMQPCGALGFVFQHAGLRTAGGAIACAIRGRLIAAARASIGPGSSAEGIAERAADHRSAQAPRPAPGSAT